MLFTKSSSRTAWSNSRSVSETMRSRPPRAGTDRQLGRMSLLAGDMQAEAEDYGDMGEEADDEVDEDDWVEEYDPTMSPPPAEVSSMTLDDRRLPVIDEEDHIRAIVSFIAEDLCTS